MTDSDILLEVLGRWCLSEPSLRRARRTASVDYFGYEIDITGMGGSTDDEATSANRRFIGWFMFDRELTNGMSPAAYAVTSRGFSGMTVFRPEAVLESLKHCRYVFGLITKHTALGLTIECGDEMLQVRTENRAILRLPDGHAFAAHLVPDFEHPDDWAVGPGWIGMTMDIDPERRGEFARFRPSPIEVEAMIGASSPAHRPAPTVGRRPRAKTIRHMRDRKEP